VKPALQFVIYATAELAVFWLLWLFASAFVLGKGVYAGFIEASFFLGGRLLFLFPWQVLPQWTVVALLRFGLKQDWVVAAVIGVVVSVLAVGYMTNGNPFFFFWPLIKGTGRTRQVSSGWIGLVAALLVGYAMHRIVSSRA
jgi:hypothetical protein